MEKKHIIWKRILDITGKVLKIGFKTAVGIVGLAIVVIVFSLCKEYYDDHLGKYAHYYDRQLSEDICVHVFENGDRRVYDLRSGNYTTPRLDWVSVSPERDSLAVFSKDEKRGFINVNTGKIAIEARYEHAWVFSEGLAAVVEPGGKMGFIDSTGEYVVAPEFSYFDTRDYVFKHGVCCIENKDGNQGLISRDGTWVLPQEYSYIDYIPEVDMFIPTKDKKKGLVRNGSFEWVYPMEYDSIYWTDAPTGEGFVLYKDFCSKHVALDGRVIDSFLVDDKEELKYMTAYHSDSDNEYGISDKVISFRVFGLWGVMDKQTGNVLVPAKYGDVSMVSESIIKCSIEKYGTSDYVLFDLKGNKIE